MISGLFDPAASMAIRRIALIPPCDTFFFSKKLSITFSSALFMTPAQKSLLGSRSAALAASSWAGKFRQRLSPCGFEASLYWRTNFRISAVRLSICFLTRLYDSWPAKENDCRTRQHFANYHRLYLPVIFFRITESLNWRRSQTA